MTVKECYEVMKGDYDDVMSRLRSDDRVKKFLLKVFIPVPVLKNFLAL